MTNLGSHLDFSPGGDGDECCKLNHCLRRLP